MTKAAFSVRLRRLGTVEVRIVVRLIPINLRLYMIFLLSYHKPAYLSIRF